MQASASTTAARIVDAGRRRVVHQGYSGFSFADLAIDVGIRKASIHHHFATKADLVVAVIDQSRETIEAQAAALHPEADARQAVEDYAAYWQRCIADGSEPFCLAGVLAAEMPNLPTRVAQAVRDHFDALERWLAAALTLGASQGCIALVDTPKHEAHRFMAIVYGAMLAARVSDEPARFGRIVARALEELFRADRSQAPSAKSRA